MLHGAVIQFACGKHISQKSLHQRESGHSTLAECVVWSCWLWSVLRRVLVFNIPLVFSPWPYWGHSSPLLQRWGLKRTYSLTAADLLSLRHCLPLLSLCAAKHRPSQWQVITFASAFCFHFDSCWNALLFFVKFDSEMLKEVEMLY